MVMARTLMFNIHPMPLRPIGQVTARVGITTVVTCLMPPVVFKTFRAGSANLQGAREHSIGINYRNKPNKLQGCIQDTKKIYDFLTRKHLSLSFDYDNSVLTLLLPENDYKADDITVLTDETDDKPTRKNILDALSRLVEGAQSKDSLFLHYSGHGSQVSDKNGDEVDGKDEGIVSCDLLIITDDELHRILQPLPSGCQLTALFDSCHSGTILDLPYAYNCIGQCYGTKPGSDISADVNITQICWSGAKDNQESADAPQGGVMTSAFIEAFENNPKQSYKELLHSIRIIVEGENGNFQTPQLGSSQPIVRVFIRLTPKTRTEMRPQFQAFCRAIHLDPAPSTILDDLCAVPAETICRTIESKAAGPNNSTFRGCLNDDWLSSTTDAMTWQRSGAFAQAHKQKGVRSVIVGDLTDEWYFYSTSSVIEKPADIVPNLERYYQDDIVEKIMGQYEALGDDATPEACAKMFGRMTSDYQVHLSVRILARDLHHTRFPVLRYEIRWTPEQNRTNGYVTHGTDTYLWHSRLLSLEPSQAEVARAWIRRVDEERAILEREDIRQTLKNE
ncbi:hypothetical protein ARMSODRAFT_1028380 [Armillaria solidipes]|uniref:Peptidase C14 caspase domain-containing protein n=1 Tax=Armillaria solidipes TaxID=1076256 RepID=A0A2H3ATQ1_9AGAR|nr:hypothetical protein ARMSODRAFT_1028380 [Armillaria solidipes]